MRWKDRLPGGRADDKSPIDFDVEQMRKGVKVEREHTNDTRLALEIALDHLAEDPRYYDKLELIDPHDDEAGVMEPEVRRAPPRELTFIEGDELYVEVGSVADALFARGADEAGNATLDWLREVDDGRDD